MCVTASRSFVRLSVTQVATQRARVGDFCLTAGWRVARSGKRCALARRVGRERAMLRVWRTCARVSVARRCSTLRGALGTRRARAPLRVLAFFFRVTRSPARALLSRRGASLLCVAELTATCWRSLQELHRVVLHPRPQMRLSDVRHQSQAGSHDDDSVCGALVRRVARLRACALSVLRL